MFWPDNAQIAVTTSLMFGAGSQDQQKTLGPFPVAQRRRMMVVSLHDQIGTRPGAIRMFDRVFDHRRRKENV
jgi:hypothetical protein